MFAPDQKHNNNIQAGQQQQKSAEWIAARVGKIQEDRLRSGCDAIAHSSEGRKIRQSSTTVTE